MTRMIKRMAEMKAEKVAKRMNIEGIDADSVLGFVCCMTFMVVGWTMCWIFN